MDDAVGEKGQVCDLASLALLVDLEHPVLGCVVLACLEQALDLQDVLFRLCIDLPHVGAVGLALPGVLISLFDVVVGH